MKHLKRKTRKAKKTALNTLRDFEIYVEGARMCGDIHPETMEETKGLITEFRDAVEVGLFRITN
jgi:hypothetical protein